MKGCTNLTARFTMQMNLFSINPLVFITGYLSSVNHREIVFYMSHNFICHITQLLAL